MVMASLSICASKSGPYLCGKLPISYVLAQVYQVKSFGALWRKCASYLPPFCKNIFYFLLKEFLTLKVLFSI